MRERYVRQWVGSDVVVGMVSRVGMLVVDCPVSRDISSAK